VGTGVSVSAGRDGFVEGTSVAGGGRGVAVKTGGGAAGDGEEQEKRKVRSKKQEVRRKMEVWLCSDMGGILTQIVVCEFW
jgi:hypothetical protein